MRFQTIRRKLATCLVLTMTATSLAPSAAFAVSSDDYSYWILDEDEGYEDEDTASDSNATSSNASSSNASTATASNLLLEEEEATPSDAIAEAVKSFNREFAFVDQSGDEIDDEDPSIPETGDDDFPYLSTTRERTKGQIDLADYDYEEKEYFISGTANTYDSDGDQLATASDADYVDRIIVFRPIDSGDFNGKVYVEILNASSNVDLPDIWRRSYDFFMREGYIYIGVTSKEGNVNSLKRFNEDRYDALTWEDNGVIWDILGQVGTALKRGGSPMLYGTETAENCYLIGQSQSGMYVNGFSDWFGDANWLVDEATAEMLESYEDVEALEDAEHIYDGILNVVGAMAHVTPEAGWDMTQRPIEASDIPFILVVGENDYNPDNIREDSDEEGDLYRSYVFAGGAHSSKIFKPDMIDEIQLQAGRPAGEYPSFVLDEETKRMNSATDFNMDVFVNAALKHLDEWAEGGAAPYGPSADEIDGEMVASGYYEVFKPERDEYGNMTTGIRSPQITVPVARYYGGANGVYSTDGGSMVYLDDDTLNSLYEDRDDYLAKYAAALDEMISEGWILEEDRALMMEIAETEPVLGQEGRNDQTIEETMAQTVSADRTSIVTGTTAGGVSYADREYLTEGEANLYGVARSTALYMRRWYSMPYTNYMRIAIPDNFNGEVVLDLVFSGDTEKNIDEYMDAGQAYVAIAADPDAASENGGNWEIMKYADEPASGSLSGPVEEEGLLWDIISQTVTTLMDGTLVSGATSVTLGIDESDADYVYTYAMYFGDFDAYQTNVMDLSGASVVALNSMDEAYDENAVIVEALSAWADNLYEPDTTIALPATIVWPADTTARETAAKEVRPNTMIVALDVDLNVYTLGGELISTDLISYLAATKDTALTAFYLSDKETADALSAFCSRYGVNDVIALASVENAAWVDSICDANAGVVGAVDFTGAGLDTSQDDL
ncbi:MAG: hypothetical protein LUC94_14545, partial [Clostridiales bacterium]|nr:hypothetical protein [Clostridiales bacterium]